MPTCPAYDGDDCNIGEDDGPCPKCAAFLAAIEAACARRPPRRVGPVRCLACHESLGEGAIDFCSEPCADADR